MAAIDVSKLVLTMGIWDALEKHNIRDLNELRKKRLGEMWVACHRNSHDDQYLQTWNRLIRLMLEHGLRFRDCDPKQVKLTAVDLPTQAFAKLSSDAHRSLYHYGPTNMQMYDYLTVKDLEAVFPRFDDALRAELKELLAACRPQAPLLKALNRS
jgi:hypothetical protein